MRAAAGVSQVQYQGKTIALDKPFARLAIPDAIRQHGIDEYLESHARWGARRGVEIGVAQAEGFRQYLGHPYPRDNRLLSLLDGSGRG